MKRLIFLLGLMVVRLCVIAQSVDTTAVAKADSIDVIKKIRFLKAVAIRAPRPLYSMSDEVVNYNVAEDPTVQGLTALDALQNAPSVEVDIHGNVKMRGSTNIEVWLNGYPTPISGEALKGFLEALPSDAIDRIEIIKNPSAKYMVESGCQIINIVTSKKIRYSQFLSASLSADSKGEHQGSMSYVLKNEKLTASLSLNSSLSPTHWNNISEQIMRRDGAVSGTWDTTQIETSHTVLERRVPVNNLFANLSYQVDSANELSFYTMAFYYPRNCVSHTTTWRDIYWPNPLAYSFDESLDEKEQSGQLTSSVGWKHKFDDHGHNLRISLSGNYLFYNLDTKKSRKFQLLSGMPTFDLTDWSKQVRDYTSNGNLSLSARYNRPIGSKDELSLGAIFTPESNRRFVGIDYIDSASGLYTLPDTLRTYTMNERRSSASLSTHWRHRWNRVTLNMGVKGTYRRMSYSVDGVFPDDSARTFLLLNPSVNLSYSTPKMHHFRLNYSYSSNHPGAKRLAASRFYDENGYTVGNPNLQNSGCHKVDFSWNRYFSSKGSVGIESYLEYATREIDTYSSVFDGIDPYMGYVVRVSTPLNMSNRWKYGVESNLTLSPWGWLNFRFYANLYQQGLTVDHPTLGVQEDRMTSYSLRVNCWMNIAKRVRVNISGSYESPSLGLYTMRQGSNTVDLGVSANFWKDRLSVTLSVEDLFNTYYTQQWNTDPYYLSYSNERMDSRCISLRLLLKLGKMELQMYQAEYAGGR